jgi:hypothetical protein
MPTIPISTSADLNPRDARAETTQNGHVVNKNVQVCN